MKISAGKDFKRIEVGVPHPARCIMVVDLGTRDNEYKGVTSKQRKLILTFEFPTELDEDGVTPLRCNSRFFTATLGPKSAFRPFLESWRGAKFTAEELDNFDDKVILGRPALITCGETQKGEKTYSEIVSIGQLPRGMTCPKASVELLHFDLTERFDEATYMKLPEWMQKMIAQSDEAKKYGISAPGQQQAAPKLPPKVEETEDEVPF